MYFITELKKWDNIAGYKYVYRVFGRLVPLLQFYLLDFDTSKKKMPPQKFNPNLTKWRYNIF